METMKFDTEIFSQFDKKWALLTAGNKDSFNTMTISWGGLGTIWNKPVATVYVRKSRYTHDFMDREDYFTVSFYPEEYKDILGILGSMSGRDMDKMSMTRLSPKETGGSVTFEQAEVTLLCRKLFVQELEVENIPEDIRKTLYADNDLHDMYIGEVIEIL